MTVGIYESRHQNSAVKFKIFLFGKIFRLRNIQDCPIIIERNNAVFNGWLVSGKNICGGNFSHFGAFTGLPSSSSSFFRPEYSCSISLSLLTTSRYIFSNFLVSLA